MAHKLGFAAGLALIAAGLSMLVVSAVHEKLVGILLILAGFILVGLDKAAGRRR